MAWLELHQTVKKHRKTLRLSSLLNISRREAVGLLCDLWLWAIDNADKHGLLDGLSAEDIGMALDMNKRQSERTVDALVNAGYLDLSDGQYVLHDWYDYCGKLNDKRETDRRRKADNRRKPEGSPKDVQRTSSGSPLVTVPNLTVPNHISSLRSDIHVHSEAEKQSSDVQKQPPLAERFDSLWSLYPKKRGKPAAFAAYKRAIKAGTTDRDIEDGIRAYVTYIDRKRIEEQFIKQGSTFFNGKAWEDDYGECAAQSEPVYTEFTGW